MTKTRTPGAPSAFFFALLAAGAIFIPYIIFDKGYFIYYGDFNVQQIPFYQLAHDAVLRGDLWNWYTDLGVNFIGSYSFYLLFSPFFWLTLPFPTSWLPHLMAPLLMLKTACASLTAYYYLRYMLRERRFAVLGGLLYALSGWMDFNIFFNHFHEVAVFFPLLLLGVEKLVRENKRGLLLAAVFINACVNYWFFVGEAVFVVLYVILRATDRSWGLTFGRFCAIALEAVLGLLCAAAVVLPSVMALMGNPRTGPEELLSGWRLWFYGYEQRPAAIVQSLFFPPELPARPNFLPNHNAKWASLSGWLPLFSMTGVLAYCFRRRDWLRRLLVTCLVFALIPGLNSLFILLNHSYYARWFYMPLLLLALATARALEDAAISTEAFARACKWALVAVLIFAVMSGLTPKLDEGEWSIGLATDRNMLVVYTAIALTSLVLVALLVVRLRRHKAFFAATLAAVLAVSSGFGIYYIANGKYDRERAQWFIDHAINGHSAIALPGDGELWSRIDIYEGTDNLGMFWRRPTIQAFHSVVPTSIMEFYPTVGVKRDVGSRAETDTYALRPLLSVRWLFMKAGEHDEAPMPGYHYYDTQNDFDIYENDNFLPMGFTYEYAMTPLQLEDISEKNRSNVMLRAIVLEPEALVRHGDLLDPLPGEGYEGFTAADMERDSAQRRRYTADSFTPDGRGFTVTTNFARPQLLFFSVPYDAGWTASDGSGALPIEKANIGFMAVRVGAGPQTIRFRYMPQGLREGLVLSAGGLLLAAIYFAVCLFLRLRRQRLPLPADPYASLAAGEAATFSAEEYRALRGEPADRAARIEKALAAAAEILAEQQEEPPDGDNRPENG